MTPVGRSDSHAQRFASQGGAVSRYGSQHRGLRRVTTFGAIATLLLLTVTNASQAHADVPVVTGTFYGNDNGLYYMQQSGNTLWWMGESVDAGKSPYQVFHRGVDSTSVFRGTIAADAVTGQWVDVSRGASFDGGTITLRIDTVDVNGISTPHLVLTSGHFRATEWTQGAPIDDKLFQYPDGHFASLNFYQRYQHVRKNEDNALGDTHNPDNLRPYRDQTVFYGQLTMRNYEKSEFPHINFPSRLVPQYDYGTFACSINNLEGPPDGDFDLRVAINTGTAGLSVADAFPMPSDFPSLGWGNANAADEGESGNDSRDILPKLLNVGLFDPAAATGEFLASPGNQAYMGAEGLMYGGDNVGQGCPHPSAAILLPGWADSGGNSLLINGRPINGNAQPGNIMQASNPSPPVGANQLALAGVNGNTITAADPEHNAGAGTEVRVTGGLVLDCGHGEPDDPDTEYPVSRTIHNCDQGEGWDGGGDDNELDLPGDTTNDGVDAQNQEIHPLYSMDIIEPPFGHYSPTDAARICPACPTAVRPNLTGAWGSDDGGTYYIRQTGNTIWWLGLTRNRAPMMRAPVDQIPDPANVFQGTISNRSDGSAVITGQAITIPKGMNSGGAATTATFTVNANHKAFDLSASTQSTFPFPSHFDKLYEPEDQTPPQSTLAVGSPQFLGSAALFITSATQFTLSGSDADSGLQTLWYRFFPQGSVPPPYTPIVLDQPTPASSIGFTISGSEGPYEVDTFATDAAGNDEQPHAQLVNLDNTPPVISITQPAASQYSHSATFKLTYSVSDGAGSGVNHFSATMDGASTLPDGTGLSNGQSISLLTQMTLGAHTFQVTAADNLGNSDSSSVTFSIIVSPQSIKDDVTEFLGNGGITLDEGNSLLGKLNAAAIAFAAGDCVTAANIYQAAINELQAQSGKKISTVAAAIMIADAQYLIGHCP